MEHPQLAVRLGSALQEGDNDRHACRERDVAPTILSLLGVDDADGMDGRPLAEALVGGPDAEQLPVETRAHVVEAGTYRAALQVSTIAGRRYVDKAWRMR